MIIDILTLFPDMFISPFAESIVDRAQKRGLVEINPINIRNYAQDRHQQVDDYPYGGGAGMVMKADVVGRALTDVSKPGSWVVYLSPQGKILDQEHVNRLAEFQHIVLLCGHYEGIDERVLEQVDEEVSIGDYILSGGELAAMVLVDAITRLIPGALGDERSALEETFSAGLLEYPHYTRPRCWDGFSVPEVLLSGHHEEIRLWRKKMSLTRTLLKRPELLLGREFDQEEKRLLTDILFGGGQNGD
jgi:tRNA (guanine37-N1)-methyltransferase